MVASERFILYFVNLYSQFIYFSNLDMIELIVGFFLGSSIYYILRSRVGNGVKCINKFNELKFVNEVDEYT